MVTVIYGMGKLRQIDVKVLFEHYACESMYFKPPENMRIRTDQLKERTGLKCAMDRKLLLKKSVRNSLRLFSFSIVTEYCHVCFKR